jgi:hypothetical protein
MSHVHNFEGFLNEANAIDVSRLKNINFIIPPFDKPYKDQFQISFNKDVDKDAVEKALKSEKGAAGVKYEWTNDPHGMEVLLLTPGKTNAGLTYVFGALDDFYGSHGEGMGWVL